jgi:hypothetical protein
VRDCFIAPRFAAVGKKRNSIAFLLEAAIEFTRTPRNNITHQTQRDYKRDAPVQCDAAATGDVPDGHQWELFRAESARNNRE